MNRIKEGHHQQAHSKLQHHKTFQPSRPVASATSAPTLSFSTSTPMEINSTQSYSKLTPQERDRFLKEGRCTYCRELGHMVSACKVLKERKPKTSIGSIDNAIKLSTQPSTNISALSEPSTTSPFVFSIEIENVQAQALIDSGATTNAISPEFLQNHQRLSKHVMLHKFAEKRDLEVAAGPNTSITHYTQPLLIKLGNHRSFQQFNVIPSLSYDVILDCPWLKHTNPAINWIEDTVRVASAIKSDKLK